MFAVCLRMYSNNLLNLLYELLNQINSKKCILMNVFYVYLVQKWIKKKSDILSIKVNQNERHSCLIAHVVTKHSLNVCLINTHILIYIHARCDCKLWNAFWFYCRFLGIFIHVWIVVSSPNIHRLYVLSNNTYTHTHLSINMNNSLKLCLKDVSTCIYTLKKIIRLISIPIFPYLYVNFKVFLIEPLICTILKVCNIRI